MKTIGIIAPSGAIEEEKLNRAVTFFETQGLKVKLAKNILDKNRYLAGNDEDKIEELHKFFQDDDIDLIMCARGGYGAIRLVNKIDYDVIKEHPKPFTGFSDVTALLLMIYKNTGMVTYHGPMACSDFGEIEKPLPLAPCLGFAPRSQSSAFKPNRLSRLHLFAIRTPVRPQIRSHKGRGKSSFTLANFLRAINGEKLKFEGEKVYKQGKAEGIIWGGNLATVVSLCGLDFIPDEDFIFFAEDLNEPVYKIDRMFQQLVNINKFREKCKGIVLGDFLDVDNTDWLEEYFTELADRLNIPVTGGFKITHNKEKITIPIGRKCSLHDCRLVIG